MAVGYSPYLHNEDMAPTPEDQRTWNLWHIAALWIGMSVCIPTYMLAGSLIQQGLSWWEAVLLIMVGNVVVLVPMILNAHAGTRYGIPFPVLLRTSYGHYGAHIPAVLRALVACSWFGVQTWIGGLAMHKMTIALVGSGVWADTFTNQFVMYLLFWAMNLYFVWNGTESIKWLEMWAAPLLIGIGLVLLGWGVDRGGGMAAVLARSHDLARSPVTARRAGGLIEVELAVLNDAEGRPKARSMVIGTIGMASPEDEAKHGPGRKDVSGWIPYSPRYTLNSTADRVWARFDSENVDADGRTSSVVEVAVASGDAPAAAATNRVRTYLLAITAMVAFWATLALNIPDISRFARSQYDQAAGQMIGLPLTMGLYSFIGLAVTCATLNIFPDLVIGADAIWDPVTLLARFESKLAVVVAMFMLAVATLTTNIAANVISPANCFTNAFPRWIHFRSGGMLAAALGVVMMPWKLLGFYIDFLITYSGLLGPIIGVMAVDYLLIRRMQIDIDALYTMESEYHYTHGFHLPAVGATLVGVAVVAAGMTVPGLEVLAQGAWFTGAIAAGVIYYATARRPSGVRAGA